jgi:hypothetical protein
MAVAGTWNLGESLSRILEWAICSENSKVVWHQFKCYGTFHVVTHRQLLGNNQTMNTRKQSFLACTIAATLHTTEIAKLSKSQSWLIWIKPTIWQKFHISSLYKARKVTTCSWNWDQKIMSWHFGDANLCCGCWFLANLSIFPYFLYSYCVPSIKEGETAQQGKDVCGMINVVAMIEAVPIPQ